MKILIVDDEQISRKILMKKMAVLGTCVTVDSSKRALAELEVAAHNQEPFDLITLDVSMPEMDGRQMLQHIRRQEIQNKIPKANRVKILMVTARMNISTIKACIKMGCNGYLIKPVSRYQLFQNLGKIGVDITQALKEGDEAWSHASAVADIINRFYAGKIALPVFPHIVREIQTLFQEKDPSIEELAQIVEKDIVISSRLISIANSALYKGMDTVTGLHSALLRLGLKTAQGVITAVAARHLFDSKDRALKKELGRLWRHSFAVATLGKHLAQAVDNPNTEDVFLMGIIHDIGKMLLMKAFTDIHPETDITERETQLAVHEIHTTFGAVLLKKMRFSPSFVHVAEFHHWNRFSEDTDQEMLLVNLADHLAYEIGFGFLHDSGRIPLAGQEEKGGETDFSKEAKETKTIKDQEEGRDPADHISLADRPQILKRLSALPALKLLDISPEAVLEITEQVRPAIRETAQAF